MTVNEQRRRGRSVLPDGATPCVWMGAGMIAYHLCDRNYDCEHCPLDAALRRIELGSDTTSGEDRKGPRWEFPEDRVYHPSHVWVQRRDDGRLRCGLDVFAERMVHGGTSWVLPAIRSTLSEGKIAFWVTREAELIPLRAPVGGTVVARNRRVLTWPGLAFDSPYHDGWLFELKSERQPRPGEQGFLSGRKMRELADRQIGQLRRRVTRLRPEFETVGRTAADGGEPLRDLWAALGSGGFRRFVQPFLR